MHEQKVEEALDALFIVEDRPQEPSSNSRL